MFTLSLLSVFLLIAACNTPVTPDNPEPAPTIGFSASELAVDAEGGEARVKVTASATWNVSVDGQDWYALASADQIYAGESILKVTAQPNNTQSARTGTIRFTSGTSSATLKVTQPFFVPELAFSPEEVTGEGTGGEVCR